MTDAYESLNGRGDEDGENLDEELLQNAHNDKEKMAATEYIAGSVTYKVNYVNFEFYRYNNVCSFSLTFREEL